MSRTIPVYTIRKDERIGSVFNDLFRIIIEMETFPNEDYILDFSNCEYLHPFFLAAFAIYLDSPDRKVSIKNQSPAVTSYFNTIRFISPFSPKTLTEFQLTMDKYKNRHYVPLCRLTANSNELDSIQTILKKTIEASTKLSRDVATALSYMMGEITSVH